MKKVEQRRERIYHYILARLGEGVSPSVREICRDLAISSTSTVHSDLHYLVDMGHIIMESGRNRTIRLPGSGSVRVALVGTVTAGQPILAVENIEEYIPVALGGERNTDALFALRVRGDSMQNAAILDGDIVVVEKTPAARNGEIVVAMVEEEATVKRFYKEKGGYRLQPENESYAPILADHVDILGRVLSVMRFY